MYESIVWGCMKILLGFVFKYWLRVYGSIVKVCREVLRGCVWKYFVYVNGSYLGREKCGWILDLAECAKLYTCV